MMTFWARGITKDRPKHEAINPETIDLNFVFKMVPESLGTVLRRVGGLQSLRCSGGMPFRTKTSTTSSVGSHKKSSSPIQDPLVVVPHSEDTSNFNLTSEAVCTLEALQYLNRNLGVGLFSAMTRTFFEREGRGVYLCVASLSHLTTYHASLSRPSIGPTPKRDLRHDKKKTVIRIISK